MIESEKNQVEEKNKAKLEASQVKSTDKKDDKKPESAHGENDTCCGGCGG